MSTAFTGIGTAELAWEAICASLQIVAAPPVLMIEGNPFCRQLLARRWPAVAVLTDIMALVSDDLAAVLLGNSPYELKHRRVFGETSPLSLDRLPAGTLGDVHIAGPPCVDFSALGRRLGFSGPTVGVFLVWARLVCDLAPQQVVIENVPQFPERLLADTLGSRYRLDSAILDPAGLGWPVRRRRRYWVCARRDLPAVGASAASLAGALSREPLPGRVLFFENLERAELPPGMARRFRQYRDERGASLLSVCDLSQNPRVRPAFSLPSRPAPTMTRGCACLYLGAAGRRLSSRELLVGQGLPADPCLARELGVEPLSFDGLSRSCVATMAGNGMHLECVGIAMISALHAWAAGRRPGACPATSSTTRPPVRHHPQAASRSSSSSASSPGVPAGPPVHPLVTEDFETLDAMMGPAWTVHACADLELLARSCFMQGSVPRGGFARHAVSPRDTTLGHSRRAGVDHAHLRRDGPDAGRAPRELFPLPLPGGDRARDACVKEGLAMTLVPACLSLARASTCALCWMEGSVPRPSASPLSAAQAVVLNRICGCAARMVQALVEEDPLTPAAALRKLAGTGEPAPPSSFEVDPDRLDVINPSGQVDVMDSLPSSSRSILSSGVAMFGNWHPGLREGARVWRAGVPAYARIIRLLLSCGKVVLSGFAWATARTFAVAKSGGRQREVWDGSAISLAAERPPKPPDLASPTLFSQLQTRPGEKVYVSKRDARAYFDQLKVPAALRPFFGRAPIRVGDLRRHGGFGRGELEEHLPDDVENSPDVVVFPLCAAWPMGFSWSSYIAQCVLLRVCRRAGLGPDRILAPDRPAPLMGRGVFALATDDVMLFEPSSVSLAPSPSPDAEALDSAMAEAGIVRHEGKDVDRTLDATCIGVDVRGGLRAAPGRARLAALLQAVRCLVKAPLLSPAGLAKLIGHCTWLALLNRPSFAVFHHVYDVTRTVGHGADNIGVPMSPDVLAELLAFVCISPLLEIEFSLPWSSFLLATDASSEFGFGVSVATVSPAAAAALARAAGGPGRYVHIPGDAAAPAGPDPARPRQGKPVSLPVSRSAFRTVISARNKYPAHSGALEAAAVCLGLRWLLRAARRHGSRQLVLIDATAVQGALCKGRSSAPSLRREVRRAGALMLAGGLCVTFAYVPSEFNPADDPSRGVVVPRRARWSAVRAWARSTFGPELPRRRPRDERDWELECRDHAALFPGAWAFWGFLADGRDPDEDSD